MTPAPSPAECPLPGWRSIEVLGTGATAVVHRVERIRDGRPAALKVLHREHAEDARVSATLRHEARILRRVAGRGIPRLLSHDTLPDGRPYLLTDLAGGRTLDRFVADAPLPTIEDRVRQLLDLAAVLADAHERGVIHGDLGPRNALVATGGGVSLIDWGLARDRRGARPPFARNGVVCGSLRYLSPEQARGDDDAIDHRTDVFGLGGLLLFVLTGWAPYEGDTEEVLRRAAHARLDQAFELLEMSPASAPVQAIVRRAMACDPARRYRDAGEFRGALETALGAAPDRRPWWRWPRRREARAAPACG